MLYVSLTLFFDSYMKYLASSIFSLLISGSHANNHLQKKKGLTLLAK